MPVNASTQVAGLRGSLQRRIVASVLLGLAVVLVGIAFLVGLAVTQSLQAALAERLAVAYAKEHEVAQEIDDALSALTRVAALRMSPTSGGGSRELTPLLGVTGEFTAYAIVDGQGRVMAEPSRTATDDGAPTPWLPAPASLRPLLAAGHPVVFGGQGRPLLILATPMQASETAQSWLVAEMDANRLVRHLTAEHSIHGTYEAELLTETGSVAVGFPTSEGVSAHAALVAGFATRREAGIVAHRVPGGAGDHYVAYVPLQSVPGWGVIVEQPRDIVVALPRRLWRWMMGIGLFVLLAGAVVAWVDVRRVVMPLRRLASLAERFGRGDLDTRVQVDRKDEIGLLGRTLEEMRSRLRASLEEIGRREARAQALYRLSTHLLTPADRDNVLQRVASEARELLEGDAAALCLRGVPALTVTVGGPATRLAPDTTCTCDSTSACPMLPPEFSGAHLSAPVVSGSTRLGQFCVARRKPIPFRDEDQALLAGLSNLVALTMENSRLQAEVRSLSALTERERIARELHDGLAQALGIIYAQARAAGDHIPTGPDPAGSALREIARISAQAYEEVRQSIFGLRTMVARRLGFAPALTEYLHEFSEHTKVHVELVVPDTFPRLPLEVEAQLIRIVQEALTNVWRHARATHAGVRFAVEGDQLRVIVDDDGIGFDWTTLVSADVRRFGLEGMRERAEGIGGSLQVDSTPGRGTRVSLTLPLAGRG